LPKEIDEFLSSDEKFEEFVQERLEMLEEPIDEKKLMVYIKSAYDIPPE